MTAAKVEEAKALAGKRAVAEHFDEKMNYVGIGSGTTILYVVDEIHVCYLQTRKPSTGYASYPRVINRGNR